MTPETEPTPPRRSRRPSAILREFMAQEASGGILLIAVSALALVVANSALGGLYFTSLKLYLGPLNLHHWINDGLMALFFLYVGLEVKRELLEGQLATWKQRALPGLAALGGVIAPALVYVALNAGDPTAMRGWAIPAATDIAFALGVLSLLGKRAPLALKMFLTALAIIDDLMAVMIIALFYTAQLDLIALGLAGACLAALVALNRFRVLSLAPYVVIGAVLWWFVLRSGIHPTLAGVALAMTIPLARYGHGAHHGESPLHRLEHGLSPWVAFAVLPVFGFANAGVSLAGAGAAALTSTVSWGVALGLIVGKQIGVFGAAWLSVRAGWASLPRGATWLQLYGVSMLCGIGFTISLFIAMLAFPDEAMLNAAKTGVLAGSLISGLAGWLMLRFVPLPPPPPPPAPAAERG